MFTDVTGTPKRDVYFLYTLFKGESKQELLNSDSEKRKIKLLKKLLSLVFPGGAVVKSPPANAGDTGSIPGLGRSNMLQSN